MKITILTYGTAGDVVPYIALALGLAGRNHQVTLAAPQNFENLVKSFGVHYHPLHGDSQSLLESEHGMKWMAAGEVKLFMKELNILFEQIGDQLQKDAMNACEGSDLIIIGTLMINYGTTISEKLKIPYLMAFVNPVGAKTKAFPHFIISYRAFPFGWLNLLTYKLLYDAYSKQTRDQINKWRVSIGLQSTMTNVSYQSIKLKAPIFHSYSPVLLPRPDDWDSHIAVTGVWKIKSDTKLTENPSQEFTQWIREGSPPVYFGFGSMPVLNPEEIQKMVYEICAELGIRAIINAGWSKFEGSQNDLGSPVYFIKQTNLEWLFPLCSIIVHHGGVGTTHLSLESGIPTIICSIFADNPLWGERLERLKIGRHIRFKELGKKKLIRAIKDLQIDEIRERARQVGEKVRKEDGLNTVIDLIEQYAFSSPVYNINQL